MRDGGFFSRKNAAKNANVLGALGLELPTTAPENSPGTVNGGAECGARADNRVFADAMTAIMRLPLSDAEKAAAVRRLLNNE